MTGRCVCVFVATIVSQVNFQNVALMPSVINIISSDTLGIAKCVMNESLQPVDALSSIDAVREPLGPATNA